MIHLEGMGILGCYCALRLDADGFPFTWHDTDDYVQAWRASTGAIFPTGHEQDLAALAQWRRHLDEPAFGGYMERAEFVFGSKHPPHAGKQGFADLGPVRVSAIDSLHLNAQQWVPFVRERFAKRRTALPPRGAEVIVTHGFGPRLARFMWGWTVPVKVQTEGCSARREALYFRRGRFTMAYAYPIPNTPWWYAGSSLISQRVPRQLDVESKFRRWRDTFLELAGGYVTGVVRASQPLQAWRPVPADGDDAWVSKLPDGRLALRPLWHSGIRHAPLVYTALKEALA